MKKLPAFLAICFFSASSASANVYDYHPDVRLRLGAGFDPREPNEVLNDCLEPHERQHDLEGAGETVLTITRVHSASDLHQAIGVDARLSVSSWLAHGEGRANYAKNLAVRSDSVTFVIHGSTNYGRTFISRPRLAAEFRGMNHEELVNSCGPEIVTEQTEGVSIFGVFTLVNMSSEEVQRFESAARVSTNAVVFSADVQASLRTFISTMATTSRLSAHVYAIGGEGITELVGLLPANDETIADRINRAPTVMRQYIGGMTRENAVPIKFNTMRINVLAGVRPQNIQQIDAIRLIRAYNQYISLQNIVDTLNKIVIGDHADFTPVQGGVRARIQDYLRTYGDAQEDVLQEARTCFEENGRRCNIHRIIADLPYIEWPARILPLEPTPEPSPEVTSGPTREVSRDIQIVRDMLTNNPWHDIHGGNIIPMSLEMYNQGLRSAPDNEHIVAWYAERLGREDRGLVLRELARRCQHCTGSRDQHPNEVYLWAHSDPNSDVLICNVM